MVDGDTLWVRPDGGGRPRKVRLHGIDAPESCQAYGAQSGAALRQRLLQQPVQVKPVARDDYGRWVAELRHERQNVGEWMVRSGHAWSYRYRRDMGPFAEQETQAQRAGRGLFAERQPELPRDFRKRHGPCRRG